jgi:glycosyltransferase involved in cell wall biosynthesis
LSTPPQVSVVVATRDRRDRVARLLAALRDQTLDRDAFEVIVADDGSSDGTETLLAAAAETGDLRLRAIRSDAGAGPGSARNRALPLAAGELIAFTDDDCEPAPHWLESGLAAWGGVADRFVQGKTLPNPAEQDRLGPFSRTQLIDREAPAYPTCNIFYPRGLLERLDGFDAERYPFWGEDTDLAWRAIAAGARPLFAPEALVHHAVNDLGPIGRLRLAASWAPAMRPYALHPELRRAAFTFGLFWKREHYWLARALLAAALPGRRFLLPFRIWLALPYAHAIYARMRVFGGGPAILPYHVLCDLLELAATARAAIRLRTPML